MVLARKSWLGPDAGLAYTVTGLLLALPAMLLPIATFSKFGNAQPSFVFSGIVALWHNGMPLLAVWAAICGIVTPVFLLGILAGLGLPRSLGSPAERSRSLERVAHALQQWSMPEVHLLAILVSFVRLGSLVDVQVGTGLWCYAAMSVAILAAWRSFSLELPGPAYVRSAAQGAK